MRAKKIEMPVTEDFQNLINLLAVYTESTNRLAELQAEVNNALLEILDEMKGEYAQAQEAAARAEAAMELIALKHAKEWFSEKRTIKTPYGTVSLRTTSKLAVSNEEATLVRIRLAAEKAFPGNGPEEVLAREEFVGRFIRTKEELNLEGLEAEEDAFLRGLGITRNTVDKFTAKPATLELGKAVKEAVSTEAAALGELDAA